MKRTRSYAASEERVLRAHVELSRAFMKLRAKESAWMAERGVTLPQFAILEALYHLGRLSVGEVTRLILSTPGNITVVIRNLESKGWIRVLASEKDRRIRMAEITPEGSALMASLFPDHIANLAAWYGAGLDEAELQTLSHLLRKVQKAQ